MKKAVLCFIVLILLTAAFTSALAYSGSDYCQNTEVANKLTRVFNGEIALFNNDSYGYPVGSSVGNYPNNQHSVGGTSGYECYIYANAVYYHLLGDTPSHGSNSHSHSSVPIRGGSSFSYELFANNGIKCGAYVRTTDMSSGAYDGYGGHSFIVLSYDSGGMTVLDANFDGAGTIQVRWRNWTSMNNLLKNYWGGYISHVINPDYSNEVRGSEMSSGYDRVLPDGDYMIASASDVQYYLDIAGADIPAAEGTNVNLWHTDNNIGDCDAWTIKYDGEGFYRISQYGTSRSLDVPGANTLQGTSIQVWSNNSSTAQQWAISRNGGFGYRIEARCSGFSLDYAGGVLATGTDVQQYSDNDSDAQRWVFIPYKPSHTLPEGRYVIVSDVDETLELDISGDTGEIENGTNLQVWHDDSQSFYEDVKSRYNAFDVTYYGNGYYQLAQAASGKVIDVDSWVRTNGANLQMWDNNKVIAQLWAITPEGDGYILRSRCSGLAMDVDSSNGYVNGTNVQQWQYNGNKNQIWKFIPAEHTVSYNANGGANAPEAQIKYYKGKLTLSDAVPVRAGYVFLGWATEPGGVAAYQPGDVYEADADIALYAVWQRTYETVLALPVALTRIEAEAFADVAADAVAIPAGVTEIGEGAFGDVVILGYAGTAAEEYADANGLTFIPLDAD